jgi:hypothetical protein
MHDKVSKELHNIFLFDVDSFENLVDSLEVEDDVCEIRTDEPVLNEDEISENNVKHYLYICYPITVFFFVVCTHLCIVSYNGIYYQTR